MMKKLIALLAVSTLVLSGCTWFQPAEEVDVMEDDSMMMEDTHDDAMTSDAMEEEAMEVSEPYKYENTKYGFTLTFPEDWGTVEEDDSGSTLTISAEDGSKDLTMMFIPVTNTGGSAVMDAPATKLGVNYQYTLYREVNQGISILEAQGEDVTEEKALEAELDKIFLTLELLDEDGEVIVDGGGGVAADEDPSNYPPAPEL